MAAAKNRAFVAIQRALKRQSLGGKEGRFAVNRTLLDLKRCQVELGEDVNSIDVNLGGPVKPNYGLKKFLYENVPQLKYKNTHVQFTRNIKRKESELIVKFADGREEKILTLEKSPSEILNELINVTTTKKILSTESQDQQESHEQT